MINMEYTNLEQKLLKILSEGGVVTHHTIADINASLRLTDARTLNNTIHNLCKKKGLLKLRKGIYFVINGKGYDRIAVSSYVYGGYVGLDTALFVYGYQQSQSNTLYTITSGNRKKTTVIDGTRYVCVPMGEMGFGSTSFNNYKVSTKAKTLFDCIYNLAYLDDLKPLLMLTRDLKDVEFNEFMKYADKLGRMSFYERAGIIFDSFKADKRFWHNLMGRIGTPSIVKLAPTAPKFGKYIGKWHIYDNIGVDKFANM